MYVIEWNTSHGVKIYYSGVTHRSEKHMSVADYEEGSRIIHRTAVLHEATKYDTIENAQKDIHNIIMDEAPMASIKPSVVEITKKDLFKSKLEYGD